MYDESWPPKGKVVFRHVSLTYDEGLDPVLSNASFIINPGEKVTCLFLKAVFDMFDGGCDSFTMKG